MTEMPRNNDQSTTVKGWLSSPAPGVSRTDRGDPPTGDAVEACAVGDAGVDGGRDMDQVCRLESACTQNGCRNAGGTVSQLATAFPGH
jgi:hypothetical protein